MLKPPQYTAAYTNSGTTDSTSTTATASALFPSVYTNWTACTDAVNQAYSFNDVLADTTQLYSTIFSHPNKRKDFKMLVFSGDSDGVGCHVVVVVVVAVRWWSCFVCNGCYFLLLLSR